MDAPPSTSSWRLPKLSAIPPLSRPYGVSRKCSSDKERQAATEERCRTMSREVDFWPVESKGLGEENGSSAHSQENNWVSGAEQPTENLGARGLGGAGRFLFFLVKFFFWKRQRLFYSQITPPPKNFPKT